MEYSSKLACLLALAFAMAAALVGAPCAAQNSPQDYVDLHNAARADVGVGPVSWDDTVAAYAQAYADQPRGDCEPVHSGGQYGENHFWGSAGALFLGSAGALFLGSAGPDWTGADAVKSWVSQKQYYDHVSNSCSVPEGNPCGQYTQVVWRNSTAIGCARDVCDNDGGVFIICNYNPPGNFDGQSPY